MPSVHLDVPAYAPETGLRTVWEDGFEISAHVDGTRVHIRANPAGLISLARHLLLLAQENVFSGAHLHLDASNSLEEGSGEIILERA